MLTVLTVPMLSLALGTSTFAPRTRVAVMAFGKKVPQEVSVRGWSITVHKLRSRS